MGDKGFTKTEFEIGEPRTIAAEKGRSTKKAGDPEPFDPDPPEKKVKIQDPQKAPFAAKLRVPPPTKPAGKRGSGPGGADNPGTHHKRRPQSPAQRAATMKNLKKARAALKAKQG